MPRLNSVPGYRLHKRTGQAVVTLRIATGRYKDFYLGEYGSQDSKDKYSALIIEHRKQYPVVPVPLPKGYDVTVDDLIAEYLTYVIAASPLLVRERAKFIFRPCFSGLFARPRLPRDERTR